MNKITITLFFSLIAFLGFTQIPNNSFENWTNKGTYEVPDNWSTMNNTTSQYNLFTAVKGTPGNPGNSYLKLTSKTINGSVVNAVAVCGKLDTLTGQAISGFPYSAKPISLTGKWQHMIYTYPEVPQAQGTMKVWLTVWNSSTQQREIVATIDTTFFDMVMSWQTFTFPFTYQSWKYPDSCIIQVNASGSTKKNYDYVYLDNLSFSGTYIGIEDNNNEDFDFTISPNPTNSEIILRFNSNKCEATELEIYSIDGKLVFQQNMELLSGKQEIKLDFNSLSSGIYSVKILNSSGTKTKKLIIR